MGKSWRRLKSCRASILLETLMATVMMAVGLTVVIQAMTGCLRRMERTRHYLAATFVLQNQLVDFMRSHKVVPIEYQDKNISWQGRVYQVEYDVMPFNKQAIEGKEMSGTSNLNVAKTQLSWGPSNGVSATTYVWVNKDREE